MLTDALKPIARAYGGRAAWAKERSEGKTQLDYEPWLIVRSHEFKARFGDWEAQRGLQRLNQTESLKLNSLARLANKAAIKAAFRNFGEVENHYDGRKLVFPNAMAGKIERHKGFDTKRVAGTFDRLFARAVPMISELEELREGHKPHPNLESFHHYVSQFEQSGVHYYIRFTAWQYKAEPPQVGISQAHSSFISESCLYEESADISSSAWVPVIDRAMTESSQNAALSECKARRMAHRWQVQDYCRTRPRDWRTASERSDGIFEELGQCLTNCIRKTSPR